MICWSTWELLSWWSATQLSTDTKVSLVDKFNGAGARHQTQRWLFQLKWPRWSTAGQSMTSRFADEMVSRAADTQVCSWANQLIPKYAADTQVCIWSAEQLIRKYASDQLSSWAADQLLCKYASDQQSSCYTSMQLISRAADTQVCSWAELSPTGGSCNGASHHVIPHLSITHTSRDHLINNHMWFMITGFGGEPTRTFRRGGRYALFLHPGEYANMQICR